MSKVLSTYHIKPQFQACLRPVMVRMANAGVSPNAVTIAALAGSVGVGGLIAVFPALALQSMLLPCWLVVRMALNALDGMMARAGRLESPLGLVLNEVGDVLSDVALVMPLSRVVPAAAWPIVSFTIAATLSEFCGLLGVVVGRVRRVEGPMGKSDRALCIGLICLTGRIWPLSIALWPSLLWAGALGALLTGLRRLEAALR